MNYQPTYHPGDYYPIFWMESRPYGGTLGYTIAPLANSQDEEMHDWAHEVCSVPRSAWSINRRDLTGLEHLAKLSAATQTRKA